MTDCHQVIDAMGGLSYTQIKMIALAAQVWSADGAELLMISGITDSVAEEWQMSSLAQGLIVTVVYTGIWLGNILSGPFSSKVGRKAAMVTSFAGTFIFSCLTATSQNTAQLMFWRVFVGTFVGLGQPASLASNQEYSPENLGLIVCMCAQSVFSFGEIYAGFLLMCDDPSLANLHWRWILVMGGLPAGLNTILCALYLKDTPAYLASKSRIEEATEYLEELAEESGHTELIGQINLAFPDEHEDAQPLSETMGKQMAVIMGSKLWYPTLASMFSAFTINYAYYGCLFAFPQVLPAISGDGTASQLMIGALCEVPGYLLGGYLGYKWERRSTLRLTFTGIAVFNILFIIGANNYGSLISKMFVYIGYYGIKMSPTIGYVVIYHCATEIYPTSSRAVGSGLVLAAGRLSAMASPLIFELIESSTGEWLLYFVLVAALAVANVYIVKFVPESYELDGLSSKIH